MSSTRNLSENLVVVTKSQFWPISSAQVSELSEPKSRNLSKLRLGTGVGTIGGDFNDLALTYKLISQNGDANSIFCLEYNVDSVAKLIDLL